MDLRQLEYVVAVAETLNFTRAAERSHVVQSALSHQVARLEAELGTRLFERSTKSVRLTASGELLVNYARRVLATVADARAELDALKGLRRGQLHVGSTQVTGRVVDTVRLLGQFHRLYPDITLATRTGPPNELASAVLSGELDIAFITGHADPPTLSSTVVIQHEPLVAIVPSDHKLARRRRVRLAELAQAGPFVEFREGIDLRVEVDTAFASAGIQRESTLELGQITDMLRCAAEGLGTAIVPRTFTAPPEDRSYHVLAIVEPAPTTSVRAIYRHGRAEPALRAFLELLDLYKTHR